MTSTEDNIEKFTAAYQAVHGKKPKVELSGGWYKVAGEKSMRLADFKKMTTSLQRKTKNAAKTTTTKKTKKKKKQPTALPQNVTIIKQGKGLQPDEHWATLLEAESIHPQYPRGYQR